MEQDPSQAASQVPPALHSVAVEQLLQLDPPFPQALLLVPDLQDEPEQQPSHAPQSLAQEQEVSALSQVPFPQQPAVLLHPQAPSSQTACWHVPHAGQSPASQQPLQSEGQLHAVSPLPHTPSPHGVGLQTPCSQTSSLLQDALG